MGITKDLIFETMDKIIATRGELSLPHPEHAYRHMLLKKVKKIINIMLSKSGFIIVKRSDFERLLEDCPTQNDEVGRKFLRYVSERHRDFDGLFAIMNDDYSRDILKWFIQYRISSALLGLKTNALFPSRFTEKEIEEGISSTIRGDRGKFIDSFRINNLEIITNQWALYNSFVLKQYAYKEIVFPKKGDYVIDMGACYGETSLWFSNIVGSSGCVWAFEPDDENYRILDENIHRNRIDNIKLEKKGAYEKNIQLNIDSKGAGSKINQQKIGKLVDLVSIDDFVKTNNISKIDYIKMDIEGAERSAIAGMKETIRKFSPTLAVSVYHLYDDIVQIPKQVIAINPNYQVFLDHFTPNESETVMFFYKKTASAEKIDDSK